MKLRPYERATHYYETDRMGVIHHSNYLRFFEEARVDLLEQVGFSYARMEELGVQMPVLESHCAYKKAVGFNERICVRLKVLEYTGLRLTLGYALENAGTGELCATGETSHCFVSGESFRPLRLPRAYPEIDQIFAALAAE